MRGDTHPHPEIGAALRWLRNRAGLRQREVAHRMDEAGPGLSVVWLSQLETGRRQPSWPLVTSMLRVLGSDLGELDQLLADRPWRKPAPVPEGTEWEQPAMPAPSPMRQAAAAPMVVGAAPSLAPRRQSPSPAASGSVAEQLVELAALFITLDDDSRLAVLTQTHAAAAAR